MGDLAPATTGLVVAAVGVILSGTFAAVLRMLILADKKDDTSYERLAADNDRLRADAAATSIRHGARLDALIDSHRTDMAAAKAEIERWRTLYTDTLGAPPP